MIADPYTRAQGERISSLASQVGDMVLHLDELRPAERGAAIAAYARISELGKQLQFLQASLQRNPRQERLLLAKAAPVIARSVDLVEQQLQRADRGRFTTYANAHAQARSMGVWSWNPNKWFLTQEEAIAYDKTQAEAELEVTKLEGEAAKSEADATKYVQQTAPTFFGTYSQVAQGAMQTLGLAHKIAIFGALAIGGWWLYSQFKPAR